MASISESRQQRRARERAKRKGATRTGPHHQLPLSDPHPLNATAGDIQRTRVLDVELYRFVDPDDPAYMSWSAEWGMRDDSQGGEDSNENLQKLVNAVIEDARHWTNQFDLRIEWTLNGDPPPGGTIADAVIA